MLPMSLSIANLMDRTYLELVMHYFHPLHSAHEDRNGHNDDDVAATNAMRRLLPIHQRLDPDSESSRQRNRGHDVTLGSVTCSLRSITPQCHGSCDYGDIRQLLRRFGGLLMPLLVLERGGGNTIDIKGTYSQCLMVASQLKSLTFATTYPCFHPSPRHWWAMILLTWWW